MKEIKEAVWDLSVQKFLDQRYQLTAKHGRLWGGAKGFLGSRLYCIEAVAVARWDSLMAPSLTL